MPKTASGRFRLVFSIGLIVLAIAVIAFVIAPAFEPKSLGGFAP